MAKKQEVVTANRNAVSRGGGALSFLKEGYKSEGAGLPNKPDDFLIPMAKVLGPQSPEVLKGNANQYKGAEAGDIMIKNAPDPLIKANVGFLFQPCFRDEAVIEWLARGKGGGGGSGFVARHPADYIDSGKAKRVPDPNNRDRLIWINEKTGNSLTHTRYVSGYMIREDGPPMPLVLPFSSTGHTVAKSWNMMMASQRFPDDQETPVDIWLVYYLVTTRMRQRADQTWYIFDISQAGKENGKPLFVPTLQDAERGKSLHQSLSRKEKDIDVAGQASDDDTM